MVNCSVEKLLIPCPDVSVDQWLNPGLCVSVRRGLMVGFYLIFLLILYLLPLGLYSPCIKDKRTLGPAPALIGHRGAPMVSTVVEYFPIFTCILKIKRLTSLKNLNNNKTVKTLLWLWGQEEVNKGVITHFSVMFKQQALIFNLRFIIIFLEKEKLVVFTRNN